MAFLGKQPSNITVKIFRSYSQGKNSSGQFAVKPLNDDGTVFDMTGYTTISKVMFGYSNASIPATDESAKCSVVGTPGPTGAKIAFDATVGDDLVVGAANQTGNLSVLMSNGTNEIYAAIGSWNLVLQP